MCLTNKNPGCSMIIILHGIDPSKNVPHIQPVLNLYKSRPHFLIEMQVMADKALPNVIVNCFRIPSSH